jgi:hypothetical protein
MCSKRQSINTRTCLNWTVWSCVLLFVHLYENDKLSQQIPLSSLALHQVPVCLVSKKANSHFIDYKERQRYVKKLMTPEFCGNPRALQPHLHRQLHYRDCHMSCSQGEQQPLTPLLNRQ